jgi:hypothetical protein
MICQACNGVIGRDCFNPDECMAITRDMADRYREQERDANELRQCEAALNDCRNRIEHLEQSKTRYMDRPDEPGMWVCFNDSKEFLMTVLYLDQDDLNRGAPFHTQRVYGPIPDFHPSKE